MFTLSSPFFITFVLTFVITLSPYYYLRTFGKIYLKLSGIKFLPLTPNLFSFQKSKFYILHVMLVKNLLLLYFMPSSNLNLNAEKIKA